MIPRNKSIALFFAAIGALAILGCKKLLPSDTDAFNKDAGFKQTVYKPILGRTTLMGDNFNIESSSLPLTFKIVSMRNSDGITSPELLKPFPVLVWKKAYDGSEKSIQEIEAKRTTEQHTLFEVGEHSGEFIMWAEAKSNIVKALPDSGYVFDVEVSNNGGRKYFNNLVLQPQRELPYEPNRINPLTGANTGGSINPSVLTGIVGDKSGQPLAASDITVLFSKVGEGNSISFKFLDTLLKPIDPAKFKLTNWSKLVHGFNMKMTTTSVKYDAAYPIPLVAIPTPYTNTTGTRARVAFAYDRIGFGGFRVEASLGLDFAIFEKGDWEVIFWFNKDNPRFTND
ncbi:hypothetical protein HDC90_002127 [Pedobacter sp. AK013]|uniref:DUF5007 domain-containing protein n=1 Tax=Pedobacter sp. AK013 TaxID=2723071 RepID=UPI00161C8ECD|nr:DUF5007 domain-containing protein [Pedobacter sp. AK013]MBB6237505.1 hypothetical protein [Pedobacter sp. AK013]